MKIFAELEVDKEKIKELNSTFLNEMGWVKDSGISIKRYHEINNNFFNFEIFEDMINIKDSMQFDSGTTICRLQKGKDIIEIEVRGHVTVDWCSEGDFTNYPSDRYKYPSDFPKELKELIKNDNNWMNDPRVSVIENNWFEIFLNGDEAYDVVDVEGNTPEQLLSLCLEMLEE